MTHNKTESTQDKTRCTPDEFLRQKIQELFVAIIPEFFVAKTLELFVAIIPELFVEKIREFLRPEIPATRTDLAHLIRRGTYG